MNQTPELTAPTALQCFHICCLTSKCILTSLWDFFFFLCTVFDERHLANWQWYPVHCNLSSALGIWAWNERAGYRLKGKKKKTKPNPKPELTSPWMVISGDKRAILPIKIKFKKKKTTNVQFFLLKENFKIPTIGAVLWILKDELEKCAQLRSIQYLVLHIISSFIKSKVLHQGSCCGVCAL